MIDIINLESNVPIWSVFVAFSSLPSLLESWNTQLYKNWRIFIHFIINNGDGLMAAAEIIGGLIKREQLIDLRPICMRLTITIIREWWTKNILAAA